MSFSEHRPHEWPAKVRAVNKAHKAANELHAILADFFRPLIGQQILKADGSLLAKIAAKLDLPKFDVFSVIMHRDMHATLAWTVKTCENIGDGSCLYHETNVYVGRMEGSVLAALMPTENRADDYTVEKVQALLDDMKAKKDAYEKARSALEAFTSF